MASTTSSATLPDLTLQRSKEVIQEVCAEVSDSQDVWMFRPADTAALTKAAQGTSNGGKSIDTDLLMGVVRHEKNSPQTPTSIYTFYLAYSTWEGRMLFIDHKSATDTSPREWVRLLARIAKGMHCNRLVWTHYDQLPPALSNAETLNGWFTLHWKLPALKDFAPAPVDASTVSSSSSSSSSPRQAFANALDQVQHDRFRLRLAADTDIDIIDRLVRGLAEFENEPESYKLSKHHLRQDGFADRPLYYCILVDDATTDPTNPYTCGMAFCYVGYHLGQGRFLYLEDLFFEQTYRGGGGGKLVMSALALVAQSLDCTKAVWQALDWNTPALNFYNKIGARVQEGLITSRFAGESLHAVAGLPVFEEE